MKKLTFNVKSKTATIALAILLMTSMTVSLALTPNVAAHNPPYWQIPTFAYVQAMPSTVGVGQQLTIYMWLDKMPDGNLMTNTIRWHNFQLTITAPDGKVEKTTIDYVADSTANYGYNYIPHQVGTYNMSFVFPGQSYTQYSYNPSSAYVNDTYMASSATGTFVVQQDPVPWGTASGSPFPTSYWTRPIYGENTNWYTLGSNWLGTGSPVLSTVGSGTNSGYPSTSFIETNPGDAVGSQTSHIMWTYPIQQGGVVGGNESTVTANTYFDGSCYNQRFTNPIIIDGYIYYTMPVQFTTPTGGPTVCQDLRTGQIIWSRNDVPALSFGYVYDVQNPNQHGTWPPILFTSNFARAFDAYTGDPLFNVTNVPGGTAVMGPQGEQLRYIFGNQGNSTVTKWSMGEWNSSKMFWVNEATGNPMSPSFTNMTGSTPSFSGSAYSGTLVLDAGNSTLGTAHVMYDWNTSLSWWTASSAPTVVYAMYNDMIICRNGSMPTFSVQTPYTYFAINLNPAKGAIGSLLWTNPVNPPAGNITITAGPIDPTARVFTEGYKETMQWVAFSMDTGNKIWGPTPAQAALDYYGNPKYPNIQGQTDRGYLFSAGYAGIAYAYNITTGKLLWTYGNGGSGNSTQGYFEVPGNFPIGIQAVGNGLIYLATTEHTIETPIYKGALTRCLNETNGQEVWTLSDYTGEFSYMSYAIADGHTVFFNSYDNQIYSLGRGPSATTVTAPNAGLAFGTPVVIRGSVDDIAAGTKQTEQAADFPNGVPCASDASMSAWMSYVYQQQPFPRSFTGVPVSIIAIDSNNNYREIGTVTTDSSGMYSLTWVPDIPGNFTVIASFAGTNGYWPSSAETSFAVANLVSSPAATATTTVGLATTNDLMMYVAVAVGALVIAIAVVGALIMLTLKKRP